jgi:ribonuclease III
MIPSQKLNNSYQRLEFLGDRVLNLIVSQYLYKRHPDFSEGDLTEKLKCTSNENLDEILDRISNEFKVKLTCFKQDYQKNNPELFAKDLEAFIGNYYLENGLEKSAEYFEALLSEDVENFDPKKDYISLLQVYAQKNLHVVPDYFLEKEEIVQNNQHVFYFKVNIGGNLLGEGCGSNKPKARKKAAENALKKLGPEK